MAGTEMQRASLDELLALHEEIAILARSGVPLAKGLFELSEDLPGRLSGLAQRLGQLLEQGRSLDDALGQIPDVPPFYRAVVTAGTRSGRLPYALEGLTSNLRQWIDLRRSIGLSALYPLFVLILVGGLASIFLPRFYQMLAEFDRDTYRLEVHRFPTSVLAVLAIWTRWSWTLPIIAMALVTAGWRLSAAVTTASWKSHHDPARWLPWLGFVHRTGQWALFCDLMALLLDHHVSWSDSLRLATDAMGASPAGPELHRLANHAQQGCQVPADTLRSATFPGLLRVVLAQKLPMRDTVATLRVMANDLRRRAAYRDDQIRQWLPLCLTLWVAGPAVLSYALLMLVPWFWQLTEIAKGTR